MKPTGNSVAFIEAAVGDGTLDGAESILATQPDVAASSSQAAAILGDDASVRRFIDQDSGG
jgi:hypothetical protein